jgi:hypothetical protein
MPGDSDGASEGKSAMLLIRLGRLTAATTLAVFDLVMLWLTMKFFPTMRCEFCGRADWLIHMKNGSVICHGCRIGFQVDARLRP